MPFGEQATALAGGLALVPNYVDQDLARQLATARIGGIQANTQAQQVENRANTAALDDDQAYQAAVQNYLLHPTPQGAHDLIVRFPKKAEPMKQAWAIRDSQQQKTDLTQMGSVLSLASAGRYDKAAEIMRQRIAADQAAGQDTKEDQALLEALESKDPDEQKLAVGLIQYHVAAITGPEHFGSVVESLQKKGGFTLDAGAVRFDDNGKVIAESPYIKGADGTIFENPKGGGQTSGGGGASPSGPFDPHQFFKDFVLPHEGGYAEHDANGAPVNFGINQAANPEVDVKSLTKDQAADIFAKKYAAKAATLPAPLAAAYADTAYINPKRAEQFLAASGGDPDKFMSMREAWMGSLVAREPQKYQPYAKAWANRNRDLRAYVGGQVGGAAPASGGGLKVIVPGKGKDAPSGFQWNGNKLEPIPGGPADKAAGGYHIMTPQENAALGLDPNVRYQRSPEGQVTALGGQEKSQGQLKPVPQAPTNSILTNRSTLREIDRAISLLKSRPQSIGLGTGALGDWFTQRNDPEGNPVRAAIGKLGGKIIHDVSGAAVTLSEAPRFQPYVPALTDNPNIALQKLQQMRSLAAADTADLESAWGPDNGYRGVNLPGKGGEPVKVRSLQEAMKLPKGTVFLTPDGRRKVR